MTTKERYGKTNRTLLSGTAISAVLVASMLLFANGAVSQRVLAQENQTSQANQTASQANQTASQANQTGNQQANQTASQSNQTASQANQTGGGANKTAAAGTIKPGDLKKLSVALDALRGDLKNKDTPAAMKKLGDADSELVKLMGKKAKVDKAKDTKDTNSGK
jgi:flagellar biosynthesis/type III secretory pathway M-ring protein FliF/YscJ